MKSQAYFEKIHKQIEIRLQESQTSIRLAVAWLTDQKLFDIICEKAKNGIKVELIIANHEINQDSSIDFSKLKQNGGSLYWIGKGYKYEALMHNKFCIIDNRVLITGSYNWTQKAKSNHESITVIEEDDNLILDFNQEFDKIINKSFNNENIEIDWKKVIIRLEILLNLIRLEEELDIDYQISKIKNLLPKKTTDIKVNKIIEIINSCEDKLYSKAVYSILDFTKINKQVSVYIDPEISALQLEIKGLEFQVTCLEDEKIDIEKSINRYELEYNLNLGDLIKKILYLKRLFAKQEANQNREKQKEYEEADCDYNNFSKAHKDNLNKPKPLDLNEEEQKEIKQNYRKATKLCHPDKINEEQKEHAQKVFIELKEAYNSNDLKKVNSILNNLEKNIFKSQGKIIKEKDKLIVIKNELESKRKKTELIISQLNNSLVFKEAKKIINWDEYFEKLKKDFNEILFDLESKKQ